MLKRRARRTDARSSLLALVLLLAGACNPANERIFKELPEPYPEAYELGPSSSASWPALVRRIERRPIVRVLARDVDGGLLSWSEEMPWSECTRAVSAPARSPAAIWRRFKSGLNRIFGSRIDLQGSAGREPATVVWVARFRQRSDRAELLLHATCFQQARAEWAAAQSLGKLENRLAEELRREVEP